jgi:hypothetical protein
MTWKLTLLRVLAGLVVMLAGTALMLVDSETEV